MVKECFKCRETKPRSAFYAHPRMADGHLGKCKECTKADVTANRLKRVEHYRQYDADRLRTPERKLAMRNKNKRMAERTPSMAVAHSKFAYAILRGLVTKGQHCERCGGLPVQGHHDDYAKPYEVMWLCPVCHAQRHKELGRLGKSQRTKTA